MANLEQKTFHEYLVPGLDALISEPNLIEMHPDEHDKILAKCKRLLIPEFYLDQLKVFGKEHDYTARGKNSTVLTANINEIIAMSRASENGCARFYNGMEAQVIPYRYDPTDPRFDPTSSTQQTIITAKYLLTDEGRKTVTIPFNGKRISSDSLAVLTGDGYLSAKTMLRGIDVAFISNETYTGRRKLRLPYEASSLWCSNHRISSQEFADLFPGEPELRPHEFVEFESDFYRMKGRTFENIGRMDPETKTLVPLKYREICGGDSPKKIFPRTAGQAMMIEALMTPWDEVPIVVVLGALGTGKTYLSAGFGFYACFVDGNTPEQKIFICPHDPALGADTGFLPGDATAKARANAMSFEDNMIEIMQKHYVGKDNGKDNAANKDNGKDNSKEKLGSFGKAKKDFEDKINTGLIQYDSIVRMGGRTLPNTFYLIDEAQDTERYQIKQLVGRTGDFSKVVVAGDPTQVTNRHLTPNNNGLVHAAAKLANHPDVMVVSFTVDEVTRSNAAQIAAKYL